MVRGEIKKQKLTTCSICPGKFPLDIHHMNSHMHHSSIKKLKKNPYWWIKTPSEKKSIDNDQKNDNDCVN